MTTLAIITAWIVLRWDTLRQAAAAKVAVAAAWALANARNLLFTAGLSAVSVGLWWERPSLSLIVPGTVVCGGMVLAWWRATAALSRDAD